MNEPQAVTDSRTGTRSRTFTWSDPSTTAAQLGRRDGLELLQAMSAGELPPPPVVDLMGMEALQVGPGRATVTMPVREYHYNPLGTVQGGVLSVLLDVATGCAVHSVLPAGVGYTSMDLMTKFLRPATIASRVLRAEGTVISHGRKSALAEGRLFDAADRLLAHATSTCLLFEMPEPSAEA